MILLESGEMYLETILVLQQRNSKVRSIDISEEMENITFIKKFSPNLKRLGPFLLAEKLFNARNKNLRG